MRNLTLVPHRIPHSHDRYSSEGGGAGLPKRRAEKKFQGLGVVAEWLNAAVLKGEPRFPTLSV